MDLSFYTGKTVLVTGHTGFKGSRLSRILARAGANVIGYSKEPPTSPSLFEILKMKEIMHSVIADVRDFETLEKVFSAYKPEIVIHMAAEAIVRSGYENPRKTYSTNVMGTVNVLEACRKSSSVRSVINVTTDKVYENREWIWGYRETDALDGYDPYSNSKSASELVSAAYKRSFFDSMEIALSTCRAGNVIGGGDFARDRIIPDCVRAVKRGEPITVRNPHSRRPYQHVVEPIYCYLLLAAAQYENRSLASAYNVGPDECDAVTTGELVRLFVDTWGEGASWKALPEKGAPHEAGYLKLDSSKIKSALLWQPRWRLAKAVEKTVSWSRAYLAGEDVRKITDAEADEYFKGESSL